MSETQKKFLVFWTKLLLIVTSVLVLFIGMFMGNEICLAIVGISCIGFFVYLFIIWVAQRIYLWRIMGVLTPEEYEVVKWYRFSLLEKGPNYCLEYAKNEPRNEEHIQIFTKVVEVKIPKILLDKSKNP